MKVPHTLTLLLLQLPKCDDSERTTPDMQFITQRSPRTLTMLVRVV